MRPRIDREDLVDEVVDRLRLGVAPPVLDENRRQLTMPVTGGVRVLREALDLLERDGVGVDDAGVRRPTLDDVFLTLTGSATEDDAAAGERMAS